MGLDLYAGTLTRYYTQNWKTVTQQWAEQGGMAFSRISPGGEGEDLPDVDETEEAVSDWRDSVLTALARPDQPPFLPWEENNYAPYYTEKPDWDAFGALLLYAACQKYGLEVPKVIPKGWDFQQHDIIRQAFEDEELTWTLFGGVEWWLPMDGYFSFRGGSPAGHEINIGTTDVLQAELERINELGWQADQDMILSWSKTEGYPADGEMIDGQYRPTGEHTEYNTESLAKFAFSIFYQAVLFAKENHLPLLMDY